MLFGLTSELFLSSLFLADFAREQSSEDTYRIYRRNAIILGPATLVTAIIALVVMDPETHWLMQGLIKQFPWFTVSIVLFVIGYSSFGGQTKIQYTRIPSHCRFSCRRSICICKLRLRRRAFTVYYLS